MRCLLRLRSPARVGQHHRSRVARVAAASRPHASTCPFKVGLVSSLLYSCSAPPSRSFSTTLPPRIFNMSASANSKYIDPPQPPPVWDHSAAGVKEAVDKTIADSKALLDQIGSLSKDKCTFDTVVAALAKDDSAGSVGEILTFYQYVSPDDSLRDAAVEADKALSAYDVEATARLDVYNALVAASEHESCKNLTGEDKRLLEKLLLQRKRNGLALEQSKRDRFGQLKKEVSDLAVEFNKRFNEEKGVIWFDRNELDGVPEDVVSGFSDKDGKVGMTFKTPDYVPVMKFAKNPDTRRKAAFGFENRLKDNGPVVQEILKKKREMASILGYENWATYVLEPKMAKDPKTVLDFLNDLQKRLTPLGKQQRDAMLQLKKEQPGEKDVDKFFAWDSSFYDRLYTEKNYDLKEELVKEYFPVDVVVPIILDIYQSLLGVKFLRVPNEKTWHKDASQWAVWDSEAVNSGSAEKGDGFLGYMHLDLMPRENKYSHAAVWGLLPGFDTDGGKGRHYPVVAMVANLAKETPGKPALMTHDNVVTFFHETGHAFHGLCSRTKYARFHGTAVARDFVEAPSQMLENWTWTRNELKTMSQHYERKGESLPADLIDKIIKTRFVNSGVFNLRQLFFGQFDMYVHTKADDNTNLETLWCDMKKDISLVEFDGAYTPGYSSFGHIVGGYDAGYYGYLYSQSFSADMFATVFKEDPMSPEKGAHYRKEILLPGGSRDEMDSLVAFLGRKPDNKAFLQQLLG